MAEVETRELSKAEYEVFDVFNLSVPKKCSGVPDELLNPKASWTSSADFGEEVVKLGNLFKQNFAKYAGQATEEVIKAGPTV
jgi:phosphoenolpyruvate carboxykinase (ATP)